jgi:aminoglycoside phosphotransferase (APT) family kinase protein
MSQTDLSPLEILRSLGIDGTPTVTSAQGGFDMTMWKVEYEGQTYALRVFRPGEHDECEHERAVMAAAQAAGLPVLEVHATGVWQDHPALLIT